MKLNIKKGDNVILIAGDDKGKTGKVTSINREKGRAIVEGLNMNSRHTKPNAANPQGGIIKQEGTINLSNLSLVSDGKATRVKRVDGARVSVKTGKTI